MFDLTATVSLGMHFIIKACVQNTCLFKSVFQITS